MQVMNELSQRVRKVHSHHAVTTHTHTHIPRDSAGLLIYKKQKEGEPVSYVPMVISVLLLAAAAADCICSVSF